MYQRWYWYNWLSWWWALDCSKHVENWNKQIIEKELCFKLVIYKECHSVSAWRSRDKWEELHSGWLVSGLKFEPRNRLKRAQDFWRYVLYQQCTFPLLNHMRVMFHCWRWLQKCRPMSLWAFICEHEVRVYRSVSNATTVFDWLGALC